MVFKVEITHLCVGQGLSVVTDITRPDDSRYLLLFDLGSTVGGQVFYGWALETLSQKIIANDHTINYVHISHLDKDHYNKFHKLSQIHNQTYKRKITVDRLVVGGVGSDAQQVRNRKDRLEREFADYTVGECIFVTCMVGRGAVWRKR